jgi:hypothetical protein
MLITLQWSLLLLCLLVVVTFVYVANLFQHSFSGGHWKAGLTAAVSLLAVFFGLNVNDAQFAPTVQKFLVAHLLSRSALLVVVCAVLAATLVLILRVGARSETIAFEPDVEMDLLVSRIKENKPLLLGTASVGKPFTRRYLSGEAEFQFSCEGFATERKNITVHKSGLRVGERRQVVDLRVTPTFVRHGWYSYPEQLHPDHYEGPPYPKNLERLPGAALCFTVGSPCAVPVRVQNIFIRVVETEPLLLSTFPAYEVGNGASPIEGWVELKVAPDVYRVITDRKASVGRGVEPADFHVHAACGQGHRFKIAIEMDWMDTRHQEQVERCTLTPSAAADSQATVDRPVVDLPVPAEWTTLAREAKTLKILFDGQACFLADELNRLSPTLQYTILVPSLPDGAADEAGGDEWVTKVQGAVQIPEGEEQHLLDALGIDPAVIARVTALRLMIFDGHTVVFERQVGEGEIVQDRKRVAAVEKAFDELSARFRVGVRDDGRDV